MEQISTKLGKKYPWVKGIQVCSNEGPCPFPTGDNIEKRKNIDEIKKCFLKNHLANFNQTWHKASLDEGDSSSSK